MALLFLVVLFLEVFAFKIDIFAYARTNFQSIFFHSETVTSEISVQNVSTAASGTGDSNRSPRIFFLMFGNKKKS